MSKDLPAVTVAAAGTVAAVVMALATPIATLIATPVAAAPASDGSGGPYLVKAGSQASGWVRFTATSLDGPDGRSQLMIGSSAHDGHDEGRCRGGIVTLDFRLGHSTAGRTVAFAPQSDWSGCHVGADSDESARVQQIGTWHLDITGKRGSIIDMVMDQVDLRIMARGSAKPCTFHLRGALAATFDEDTQQLQLLKQPPQGRFLHIEGVGGCQSGSSGAIAEHARAWIRGVFTARSGRGPLSVTAG